MAETTTVQHTPGPWKVVGDRWSHVVESEKHVIADTTDGDAGVDESYANARRIVACVNACEGVPTEVLESAAGRFLEHEIDDLAAEMGRALTAEDGLVMTAEVGALKAAWQAIEASCKKGVNPEEVWALVREYAREHTRAAIGRAKGGAA